MAKQSPRERAPGSVQNGPRSPEPGTAELAAPVSRRHVFWRAAGVAAVGAVLTEAIASPAEAATGRASLASGTTVEQGAVAPAVVSLTDAPTISLDASAGNDFRVTLAASRTIGAPLNPTDGQKITLEITQGGAGGATVTWDSGFRFATGLPRPALSTAAGQADLLGFIYNADVGGWLCVAFLPGFTAQGGSTPTPTATPTPTQTPTAPTYRLFPATSGPAKPVSYSGAYIAGVLFKVTTGGTWLDGYWWWVCPSGQPTASQMFCLWAVYNSGTGALVPGSVVNSATLTPGQWNYVPLPAPLALSPGVCYNVATGVNGSFPDTPGQFGSGQPLSAGITNGPLQAYSDQSGSNPAPFNMSQGVYSVAGTDPDDFMPANGNASDNLWIDVQVGTAAPAGTSYRLWPSAPQLPGSSNGGFPGYTLATEVRLAAACALNKLWFYSPVGSTALPTRCAVWDVSTGNVVSGTDNASPAWSGAAGSGWVACSYTGVSLPAGTYRVSAFSAGGPNWFLFTMGYWDSPGPGANGISAGPLTAPGHAASSAGQGIYNSGTWGYPATYGAAGAGENYWVDIEVTPS